MSSIQDAVNILNQKPARGQGKLIALGFIGAIIGYLAAAALVVVGWNLGLSDVIAGFGAPDVHVGYWQGVATLFTLSVLGRLGRKQ